MIRDLVIGISFIVFAFNAIAQKLKMHVNKIGLVSMDTGKYFFVDLFIVT